MAKIPNANDYPPGPGNSHPAIAKRQWEVQEERFAAGLLANGKGGSVATLVPHLFVANDDEED